MKKGRLHDDQSTKSSNKVVQMCVRVTSTSAGEILGKMLGTGIINVKWSRSAFPLVDFQERFIRK